MPEWYTCEVTMTGPGDDGTIFVRLRPTGNEFPEAWFIANPAYKRDMLAVALSSLSLQSQVAAWLSTTTQYSQIDRLYVHRPL
jgi:hypothetical protein